MSGENKKDDEYHTYLEEKHSRFAVRPELVDEVVYKAVGETGAGKRRIIAGEVNEVYEVNTGKGDFIVRISYSDRDHFTPEKCAIDMARKAGVPVPEVLLIEKTEDKNQNVTVAVENKLAGKPLSELDLPVEDMKLMVANAGELLARIHSVPTEKFGYLDVNGRGKDDSWEEYMLGPLQPEKRLDIHKSAKNAGITEEKVDTLLGHLDANKDLFTKVEPHLLHGDFGLKHILIDNGNITGIIDFENAKSGDTTMDLAWWSYFGRHRPPVEWLLDGYAKVAKLPEGLDQSIRVNRIRIGMDLLFYYDVENNKAGMDVVKQNIDEDLAYFS